MAQAQSSMTAVGRKVLFGRRHPVVPFHVAAARDVSQAMNFGFKFQSPSIIGPTYSSPFRVWNADAGRIRLSGTHAAVDRDSRRTDFVGSNMPGPAISCPSGTDSFSDHRMNRAPPCTSL